MEMDSPACAPYPVPWPPADLEQLGEQIAELSAHLEAATARLLQLIREFDARQGWNTGFRSCAAWLGWKVGLNPGAARGSAWISSGRSVSCIRWPIPWRREEGDW